MCSILYHNTGFLFKIKLLSVGDVRDQAFFDLSLTFRSVNKDEKLVGLLAVICRLLIFVLKINFFEKLF